MAPMVLLGYGSLLSKKGLTREGTAPTIHGAWAARVPGVRGFGKTFRGGRKRVMDAEPTGAGVTELRPLLHYVEGRTPGVSVSDGATVPDETSDHGTPEYAPPETENTHDETAHADTATAPGAPGPARGFEAIALLVDRPAWSWFDAREEFPPGLGPAILHAADEAETDPASFLARLRGEDPIDTYLGTLWDRFGPNLAVDHATFLSHYLPVPLALPTTDTTGRAIPATHGLLCTAGRKEFGPDRAHEARRDARLDPEELASYYLDCILGAAHGLDVADIRDPTYERIEPRIQTWYAACHPDETRPLAAFLGNPKGHKAQGHGTPSPMRPVVDPVPVAEAVARLEALAVRPLAVHTLPLAAADGRVIAEAVRAPHDIPGFEKSAMDGYAVRAEDTYGAGPHTPRSLRLVGTRHAGATDQNAPTARAGRFDQREEVPHVATGTCVQIATGAALPPGADAVVMVEATSLDDDVVSILRAHAPGQNVIRPDEDVSAGQTLVAPGTRLGPGHLAALASTGTAEVAVLERPSAIVIASGDEVVPVGQPLRPGAVYDSNTAMLAAALARLGVDVRSTGHAPDEPDALTRQVREAAQTHDLVIITGGTSAGERDLLPDILRAHGEVAFHGVRMRPGKPAIVGRIGESIIAGLPGYPTSCLVAADALLVPLIERMCGGRPTERRHAPARLVGAIRGSPGWTRFVPVRLEDDEAAVVFRGAHAVSSIIDADGLIVLGPEDPAPQDGDTVMVRLWSFDVR